MNEWNIQSRAHVCQTCGRHFADRQPYHTLLVDQRREVSRHDLCETCWREGHADGASSRQGFISHWQGVYESPPPAPPEPIRKENAEGLLRRLIERNDPRYVAAAYILAAMLERKRILKVKEQFQREGRRVFVYEHPKTADIFTITDPELHLNHADQVQQVQREVAELLEHGLPPEPGAGGPAPGPEAAGGPPVAAAGPDAETAPVGASDEPSEPVSK